MWETQITGETVGEVRPVADMHQRKAEMARHSDCFIALPGPITLPHSLSPLSFSVSVNSLFVVRFCSTKWGFVTTSLLQIRWIWDTGRAT